MASTHRPLKVALVHSFYSSQQASGENAQVEAEAAALRRAGVDARLIPARTDELEGQVLYRTRAAVRVASGHGRSPIDDVQRFGPDVVHVHNLFPNFSRSWVSEIDVPVIVTLHNFRTVCAAATLFRDGRLCTDCPDGRRWSGLKHRCYRNSFVATAPLSFANRRGPASDPVLRKADRILCLSPRQQRILEDGGIAEDRLVAWTNFLPDELCPAESTLRRPCIETMPLYVGRLTVEKGCLDLVRTWPNDAPLRIVGNGPLASEIRQAARGRPIQIHDRLPRDAVLRLMQGSDALLLPSGWPEGMPLVFVEAMACGLPVVVRDECDLAGRIRRTGVGAVVGRVEDMATAVQLIDSDWDSRARRCRIEFHRYFTETSWVERTIALYESLLKS